MFIPPKYSMNQRLDLFSNLKPQTKTGFGLRRTRSQVISWVQVSFGCLRGQQLSSSPVALWFPNFATPEDGRCRHVVPNVALEENENRSCKE